MYTGKIELSVGTTKIANKYEILTEEEINNINNKIPELDERVTAIEEILSSGTAFGEDGNEVLY